MVLRVIKEGAVSAEIAAAIAAQKGAANGIAPLGADARVPAANSRVESVAGKAGAVVLDHNADLQNLTVGDPHTQYLNEARGDARYVNETDHTKAAHDALLVDAATLDGLDSTALQVRSEKGSANGYPSLDATAKVPTAQLPDAVLGGVNYRGTWDAAANAPTLAGATGTKGHYYRVSVAGATNLDGITDWKVGDWAIYNGASWEKVDNTDQVTSVNGRQGAVTGLVEGNDGRLSDTRTPTDGSVTRVKMSQTNRGLIICTSTTRPTGTDAPEGQHIYETDTDATLKNTGTPTAPVWSALGGGGGGYVSPTHIAGLALRWNSGSALSVESGGAYVPSKGGVLDVPDALSLTGLTFTANTWYYAYLFDNAGTPVLELSTVAPAAPYRGSARVRLGGTAADNARRFLGAVKSNADATPRMLRWLMQGNAWFWQEPTNAAPFRILLGGTATTETTLDLSPAVPLNARSVTMNAVNTSTDKNANFSNADVSGVLLAVRTDKQVAATLGTTANQTVSYFYPTAPTNGSFTADVLAFGFAR